MTYTKTLHYSIAFLIALIASLSGLLTPSVEGLDSSHNVMDGFYFHDLLKYDAFGFSHPKDIVQYTLDYQAQYPALGFIYWLPFSPFIESLFFMMFGPSLFTAQLSVFLFTAIFALSFLSVASRLMSPWIALSALISIFTVSEIWVSSNTIMRDMPALSTMMITFWGFLKWFESSFANKWLGFTVLVAAIAIYTKQTTAIVPISLFISMLTLQPKQLLTKSCILSALGFVVLITPAIIYTFTLGSQNLGQSFGSSTSEIMANYEGVSRLSLENWLYYIKWSFESAPILTALAPIGVFIAFKKNEARLTAPSQRLIITGSLIWLAAFYLFFSYFDNKAFRFGTLWVPPLFMFAAIAVSHVSQKVFKNHSQIKILAPCLVIFLISGPNILRSFEEGIPRMSHIDEVTTQLMDKASLTTKDKNCIHYVGDFKQVFVQSLRRLDGARKLHLTPVTLEELQHNTSTDCAVITIEESALLEGKLENNKILKTLKESGYSLKKTHFNSPKLKRNIFIFSTH